MEINKDYEWFVCELCGPSVRCLKCGNNCCNACYGTINGKQCDMCPKCYDIQDNEKPPKELVEQYEKISKENYSLEKEIRNLMKKSKKKYQRITNLSGDCCSKETVEIPVALLHTFEEMKEIIEYFLPTLQKYEVEKGYSISSENEEESKFACSVWNLECCLCLLETDLKSYFEKKIPNFKWPEIKHTLHKNLRNERK